MIRARLYRPCQKIAVLLNSNNIIIYTKKVSLVRVCVDYYDD